MNPFLSKHAEEIRQMWQSRALVAAEGKLGRVLLVVFAKEYAAALPILLRVSIPGFEDIKAPFLSGYASIMPTGRLVCDMTCTDGSIRKTEIYRSNDEFVGEMRRLADRLKLSDEDRDEMFMVLRKWVTADLRIDHEGKRLAS
jgi:hypothetical protein